MSFGIITFPKEDARILWNVNKEGCITEIEVARFTKGKIEEWPGHLHRLYTFDIGNASNEWHHYTLATILMKFFTYGFADKHIANKFIKDLGKIDEFKAEVGCFICILRH